MDRLIDGAKRTLKEQKEVRVIRVPGSFEIPLAAKAAAMSKKFDAIVALGCVVRGETPHFEYISSSVSHALQQVALESGDSGRFWTADRRHGAAGAWSDPAIRETKVLKQRRQRWR